jgi:peptidoglycan/LPS O-acetylase OafA/YrhL
MAKIIATTFGAVLVLFGLSAFASPTLLGAHGSPLNNLLNILLGGLVLAVAQRGGPSIMLWSCAGTGLFYLAWGLVGFALGQPRASSLGSMPPDLCLLVVIPGFLESARSDHVLHLFFGIAFCISAMVAVAETPFRLRK